jgi:hypothetical protein
MKVEVKITVKKENLTYKFNITDYDTMGKLVDRLKDVLEDYKGYKAKLAKKEDERQLPLPWSEYPKSMIRIAKIAGKIPGAGQYVK